MAFNADAIGGPGSVRVDGKTIYVNDIVYTPGGLTSKEMVVAGQTVVGPRMEYLAGKITFKVQAKSWKPEECMAIQGSTLDVQDITGRAISLKGCHYIGQPSHNFNDGEWDAEFGFKSAA